VSEIGCNVPKSKLIPSGSRSINSSGNYLTVLERADATKSLYRVLLDSGITQIMGSKEIRNGKWKDNMSPTLYGIGFIGDGVHMSKVGGTNTSTYDVWRGIMRRCYDVNLKSHYPTYGGAGITVAEDWHNFQNFAEWYQVECLKLPDIKLNIDKDLKGGKIYSPDNCVLLPYKLNNFITNSKTDGGLVGYTKPRSTKYTITLSILGKQHYIGEFPNQEEGDYIYRVLREWTYTRLGYMYHARGMISDEVLNLLSNQYSNYDDNQIQCVVEGYSSFIEKVNLFLSNEDVLTCRVKKLPK